MLSNSIYLELKEILSFRYKNRERKKEKQGLIHYLTLLTDTSLYKGGKTKCEKAEDRINGLFVLYIKEL